MDNKNINEELPNDGNKNQENNEPVPESNAARLLKIHNDTTTISYEADNNVKKSFWGNIWYHYKLPILIIISFIIIFSIAFTQLSKRDNPDIYIFYAGPVYLDSNSTKEIESIFKSIMSEDYNNDGEKGVQFNSIVYLSDDVISERKAEAKKSGRTVSIDKHANMQSYEAFSNEMLSGDSVICLLDPSLYANVKEAGGFLKLSEIFDDIPNEALDEYGIKFSETKIYKYYSVFQSLPEDTILAVRRVSTMSVFKGKKKTEQIHSYHVQFTHNIINFEYPEGYSETEIVKDTQKKADS